MPTWLAGQRFSGSANQSTVESWVKGLELPNLTTDNNTSEEDSNTMYIKTGGTTWTATLADNSSAAALKALLAAGPLTINMSDYGNFEKVGPIGSTLPRNDEQITTEPGDLILYQGANLVIYYDTNSYTFTRLSKINDVTQDEMKNVLGTGDVTLTFSLTK